MQVYIYVNYFAVKGVYINLWIVCFRVDLWNTNTELKLNYKETID